MRRRSQLSRRRLQSCGALRAVRMEGDGLYGCSPAEVALGERQARRTKTGVISSMRRSCSDVWSFSVHWTTG